MKTLDHYMNDPSVAHLQMPLREVKAIRLMVHDEIKDMTPSEVTAHYSKSFEEMQKKYGFKLRTVTSAN